MDQDFTKRIAERVKQVLGETETVRLEAREPRAEERLPRGKVAALKVAIGSDHRGFTLKGQLAEYMRELGHSAERAMMSRRPGRAGSTMTPMCSCWARHS
jgi:hypothetical protein